MIHSFPAGFSGAFLLLIVTAHFSFGQPADHMREINHVQAFTGDSIQTPVYIYDAKNGSVIDSVLPAGSNCYILVLINTMEEDWVQLERIYYAPCPSDSTLDEFTGKWLYKTDLFFNISTYDDTKITVYRTASKKTVLTTFSGFETVRVIDTHGNRALVEFTKDSKKRRGWIERFDQCAYRWTECNWEYFGP